MASSKSSGVFGIDVCGYYQMITIQNGQASQLASLSPTTQHPTKVLVGSLHPYELYHGIAARDTFSAILNESTEHLVQLPDEAGDIENARLFAIAVRTSTTAFIQLARNHDQYLKNETAATLNEKGFPRSFIVGDKVKARFPPTQAELEATGRRSNHVSTWRGSCRI